LPLRTPRFPRTGTRGGLGRLPRSAKMLEPTALLISQDASLIGAVREALGSVSKLSVRNVEPAEGAPAQLQRPDVVLLLLHLTRGGSAAAVGQLLQAPAARRSPLPVTARPADSQPQ